MKFEFKIRIGITKILIYDIQKISCFLGADSLNMDEAPLKFQKKDSKKRN